MEAFQVISECFLKSLLEFLNLQVAEGHQQHAGQSFRQIDSLTINKSKYTSFTKFKMIEYDSKP